MPNERDFDDLQPADAPIRSDDFLDETQFDRVGGLVEGAVLVAEFLEFGGSSHSRSMLWREVMPCFKALPDDFARVSAVLGPFDLAPLMRAVSDCSCDGIVFLLDLRLLATWRR